MRTGILLLFLMIFLPACGQQRAPELTPVPARSATSAITETPSEASATSALVIQARASATPFTFPRQVVPAPICEGAPPTNLIVHERARVTNDDPDPLNVRDEAGLAGEVVAQLDTLDIVMVVDGPRCADDYTWYRVRAGRVEGWVAEGDGETYYVEPYTP